MERTFSLGPSPHLYSGQTASKIVWSKTSSLLIVWLTALILVPLDGLRILGLSLFFIIALGLSEKKLLLRSTRLSSGYLILNAVLFASLIPVFAPWWFVLAGCFLFFAVGEVMFGGEGQNIFHPALVAIAILTAVFPPGAEIKTWAISSASDFFLARGPLNIAGASPAAVLIAAAVTFLLKSINWEAPFAFAATSSVFFFLSGGSFLASPFIGTVLFLVFFVLTDFETSPVTRTGRLAYGVVSALLVCAMSDETRFLLSVSCALLIANASVPLLDYLFRPKGARA